MRLDIKHLERMNLKWAQIWAHMENEYNFVVSGGILEATNYKE